MDTPYKNTVSAGDIVQTETIAGVQCLHIEVATVDVPSTVALWRATHLAAHGTMGVVGVCVCIDGVMGRLALESLFHSLRGLPAASIVLNPRDCHEGRHLSMAAAQLGEIRAIFDDLLTAVVWIAARAKALLLARSLPKLEPELQEHRRVRA